MMKKPLFIVLVGLCLSASLALPATQASHPSKPRTTHAPAHSATTHRTHHSSAVRIPHERRHVTYQERKTLFERAGIPRSEWHNYIVDHRIPLELGGSNSLSNLQVQPREVAHRKDRVENYLAAKVRRGEMTLPQAQSLIQHWQTVDTAH